MKRFVVALAALGLAGCVQLAQPAPHVERYRFDYEAPALGLAKLPFVLRLSNVDVAAAYDREPIAYRTGPFTGDSYHYHRWSAAPGALVHDILVRDLIASNVYRGVQATLGSVPADFEIAVYIDTLEEQSQAVGCSAVLVGRVSVVRQQLPKPATYVAELPYRFEESIACNQPHALVAALSRDLQHLSEALQKDVHQVLSQP